jgi:heparan-alpha-glucosaminide N-acetyltransferase
MAIESRSETNKAKPASPMPARLASIDAYRGLVMCLMMAEVLELAAVSRKLPDSPVWKFLAHHQSHVAWGALSLPDLKASPFSFEAPSWSLHDLIQPSFSFLVGVALPFSLAARAARGQGSGRMIGHAAWRAFLLVVLGIFLRSIGSSRTNFTFEDTLTQIGLGYFPLFLLSLARPRWWWVALAAILVGYWAAFALYPLPGPDFDYGAAGVRIDWPYHYSGFAAHWNKNTNLAWAFDSWFLNLFPRNTAFLRNGGGYVTLSFIPTLGTMILGLVAGNWLQTQKSALRTIGLLLVTGLVCLGAGWIADYYGICPSVKRIWTPAFTLTSGGCCFIIMAAFYATIDVIRAPAWSFPLRVIGMNSIAAYCMAHLFPGFIAKSLRTHLGSTLFTRWGTAYEPFLIGAAILLVYWLILYWMYRRRIFLRI